MKTTIASKITSHLDYTRRNYHPADHGWCEACGALTPFRFEQVINSRLAKDWSLDAAQREAMSARESSYCAFCGCSARLQLLARGLRKVLLKSDAPSLQEAIRNGAARKLKLAEINSCGKLHAILSEIKDLKYSEYGPTDQKIRHENLMGLSYQSNSFDVVLTSDTLEHVPDPAVALSEIYRVLKPGGVHLFTIPWLLDRPTIQRTGQTKQGDIRNIKRASYHGSGESDYLVWHEFGYDFIDTLENAGFNVTVLFQDEANLASPFNVILARKPPVPAGGLYGPDEMDTPIITDYGRAQLNTLAVKLGLTEQHAANLEQANRQLAEHSTALERQEADLRTELKTIHESRRWQLISRWAAIAAKMRGRG